MSRVKSEVSGLPSGVCVSALTLPCTSSYEPCTQTSSLPPSNSQSKIPSKLRDSSTARGSTGDSSRESSPDASLSSTLSSSFKNHGLASRPKPVPLKVPSQPRPPPPVPAYLEGMFSFRGSGSFAYKYVLR